MGETIRPDDVIPPQGGTGLQVRRLARDLALLLPNILKLLARLIRDPRVPRRSKLLVGGLLAYLASPVDLVPDFIPAVGMADDVLLSAYALAHLIERAGEDVVLEHWDGPSDLLEMVRDFLDAVGAFIPARLRRWVDRLGG
ncbi:MAG: YkvA family protein [Actinomycetota bacterium]